MTVSYEFAHRGLTHASHSNGSTICLEDRFEVLKEIGDGSFGSVALARVRSAGASVARRGTLVSFHCLYCDNSWLLNLLQVAIKTMKKTFDSFAPCLELREVIFLRSLPVHPHLVPALDIFLDPMSKKLHICMEYMDGNLYQLMKARDHKCLDGGSVKSILFQILAGLDHVHAHNFFHRDIKPENILVSTSAPQDSGNTFRRYSALVTPPSTPPLYTVKIADFGLARETHSKLPYTTYVSTRWYRAPEVLLRAGEYSAPVDMWAIGAMAVEIATLKPLFPGGNEVDQVWRVCEIMGSPGNWYNKGGAQVGGGDWREGTRLAQKLGFAFPKARLAFTSSKAALTSFQMAPHSMDTILQPPQWPAALSAFVTWCLMWDPKNRPTSAQAMSHEYFADAVDPMRPKSSASRLLSRKHSDLSYKSSKDPNDNSPVLSSKPSWFRKSLITRDSAPAVPSQARAKQTNSPRPSPVHSTTTLEVPVPAKARPVVNKRATWTNGTTPSVGAPMPILPSIRPISPLSDAVTAQATGRLTGEEGNQRSSILDEKSAKKLGRQLSVASTGNHYADIHRQEAERALNGNGGLVSPPNGQKESFFSHLRKRARRLSGRHATPLSPNSDDIEANAGCGPWSSNRSSMALDAPPVASDPTSNPDFTELDRALQNVRYSIETPSQAGLVQSNNTTKRTPVLLSHPTLKRHHSLPQGQQLGSYENVSATASTASSNHGPISSRTRRALQMSNHPVHRYETPDEEDELLDEVLNTAHKAVKRLDRNIRAENESRRNALAHKDSNRPPLRQTASTVALSSNPYPTPSPSARRNGVLFGQDVFDGPAKPLNIEKGRTEVERAPKWPTPPYEENEWSASATSELYAARSSYK